jgi:lycopene cyclase domain-containing protein
VAEYTVVAVSVAVGVVLLERFWFRSGLFRSKAYWITLAIVVFFQTLVDGWLTRLPDPIVSYDERFTLGVRFPFDIPVEDWLFGFSLVTLALLCWLRTERTG